jgi:hypothetical protein
MNPQFIPDTEWLDLAQKFVEIIDDDEMPFDESLINFSEKICKRVLPSLVEQRGIEFLNLEQQLDMQKDVFQCLNLGFIYGFSLGRIMYDASIRQGDIS